MIEVEEEEERLVCYFLKSPAATKILIQNVQSEAEANAMNPTRNVHMSFSLWLLLPLFYPYIHGVSQLSCVSVAMCETI